MDVWYIPTFGRILWHLYVNNTSEMDPKGFEISQFSVKPEKEEKQDNVQRECEPSIRFATRVTLANLVKEKNTQNMCCCVFFF